MSVPIFNVCGSGPPIVFIAGFASTMYSWSLQQKELRKYFNVISINNRGVFDCGIEQPEDFTVNDLATDVANLLNLLSVEKAFIMGSSMGAMVALEFAQRYPERVSAMVLSSLPLNDACLFSSFIEKLIQATHNHNIDYFTNELVAVFFSDTFLENNRDMMYDFIIKSISNIGIKNLHLQLLAIQEWYRQRTWLKGCSCPCLFIYGSEDKRIALAPVLESVRQSFPLAKLNIIEAAGHAVHIEKYKEFNRSMLNFLHNYM